MSMRSAGAWSAAFPGKEIVIGEVGWPSAGRMREGALPSPANQARVIQDVLARGKREHFRVNVIEAFDQPWKRALEGTVGGHWGLFDDATRAAEIRLGRAGVEPSALALAGGRRRCVGGRSCSRAGVLRSGATASPLALWLARGGDCDRRRRADRLDRSPTCRSKALASAAGCARWRWPASRCWRRRLVRAAIDARRAAAGVCRA